MGNLYRVRVTLDGWSGGPGLATHYFEEVPTPVLTPLQSAQAVADRVRAAWVPVAAKMPSLWTCVVQTTVDILNPASGALIGSQTVTAPAALGGTEGTKFGLAAAGVCVNWQTTAFVNGRRVRGRTFVSPLNDGQDADGTPSAAHVAAVLAMGPILQDFDPNEPLFVVWHRPIAGAGGSAHIVNGVTARDSGSMLTSRR